MLVNHLSLCKTVCCMIPMAGWNTRLIKHLSAQTSVIQLSNKTFWLFDSKLLHVLFRNDITLGLMCSQKWALIVSLIRFHDWIVSMKKENKKRRRFGSSVSVTFPGTRSFTCTKKIQPMTYDLIYSLWPLTWMTMTLATRLINRIIQSSVMLYLIIQ